MSLLMEVSMVLSYATLLFVITVFVLYPFMGKTNEFHFLLGMFTELGGNIGNNIYKKLEE